MKTQTMAGFCCWSGDGVAETVYSDIGALPADASALFLAAHTPIELDQRKGPEVQAATGEQRVLEALTSGFGDLDRNTLVAVTGPSGSGKSHVVRWVHAHLTLDDPAFAVLYVPRAVQTLRDLLRHIIDGLPGVESTELMSRVDAAIAHVKPGEFLDRLVNDIQVALDWTLEDRLPDEGESSEEAGAREDRNSLLGTKDPKTGGRRDGLGELLNLPQVKEALQRPGGRLSHLVDSYFRELSRRDQDEQTFTAEDLALRARGVRSALSGRGDLIDLWDLVRQQPEDALGLMEEALRVALPRTVGLQSAGGETLESLFLASRKALRAQGTELILVFEDLAQFGMVDGALYDQFVTQPGDELAPLRVLFAVTDGPYARMERTLRTRMTYEFHVGDSALSNPEQFLARYLNLVRVGREETLAIWSQATSATPPRMLNACDTREEGHPCRFRDECQAAFGSVSVPGLGDVGLYPYNHNALARSIRALGTTPTPRLVMDECVYTNLLEAEAHLSKGDYPHERVAELFDFSVHTAKDALQNKYPSSDPERLYRALVVWGNEEPLPEKVLEAFSLESSAKGATAPRPRPRDTPTPDRLSPSPLLPLFRWLNKERLPDDDANYYRDTLRALVVERLQLDEHLIHIHSGRGKALLDELFSVTSFSIEDARGRRAGTGAVQIELRRTPEDVHVMAAARWFRDHGHFDPEAGLWPWPEGYEPAVLMVALEARLDQWAAQVQSGFLDKTGGSRLAEDALGIRAALLVASGFDPGSLDTATDVLSASVPTGGAASDPWEKVDGEALKFLSSLVVPEYIAEFAAVRQGSGGKPQLIDPRTLNAAVRRFIGDPRKELERVAASSSDPNLKLAAGRLLQAAADAAPADAKVVSSQYQGVQAALEGQSPASLGDWAQEVGAIARDAGFFRPSDSWVRFERAVENLKAVTSVEDPALGDGRDLNVVLLGQYRARGVAAVSRDLKIVVEVMTATKRESERSGSSAGNASVLAASVRKQVKRAAVLTRSLVGGTDEKQKS